MSASRLRSFFSETVAAVACSRPRTGSAFATSTLRVRAAGLLFVAVAAMLVVPGDGRDAPAPPATEGGEQATARPGVEQMEPLGGKLFPPRYETLDYQLNQLVARHEGRDAAPGAAAPDAGDRIDVIVRLDPARLGEMVAYLREGGVPVPDPRPGDESLSARVPIALLPGLAARPGVQRIVLEPEMMRLSDGITPHGADAWHEPGWTGAGVKIGIIDTGFAQYAEARAQTPPFVPAPDGVRCPVLNSDGMAYDVLTVIATCATGSGGDSHGTWVAELIYDIAPEADFYLARAALRSHFGDAVDWMVTNNVDVISTSLGVSWEGAWRWHQPLQQCLAQRGCQRRQQRHRRRHRRRQ